MVLEAEGARADDVATGKLRTMGSACERSKQRSCELRHCHSSFDQGLLYNPMKVILISGHKNSPEKSRNLEGIVEDWKGWTHCLTSDVENGTGWVTNWVYISLIQCQVAAKIGLQIRDQLRKQPRNKLRTHTQRNDEKALLQNCMHIYRTDRDLQRHIF